MEDKTADKGSAGGEMGEVLCMAFIRYCEAHMCLNLECGLSTIEYIRQCEPKKALEFINSVMRRRRDRLWLMPKPGDERLQFVTGKTK